MHPRSGPDCANWFRGSYVRYRRHGDRHGILQSLGRKMLDGLRQFIADVVSPAGHEQRSFDDTGYRLAATALLIHVISIDGEPTAAERSKLHSLIESSFGLDRGTADRLIASATLV